MLCSVGLWPSSLRFRKIIFPKVIYEKASDTRALDLVPLDPQKMSNFLQLLRYLINMP